MTGANLSYTEHERRLVLRWARVMVLANVEGDDEMEDRAIAALYGILVNVGS